MIKGLHVGFGRLLGVDLLAALRARGVKMIRSEYLEVLSACDLHALIGEVVQADLHPLSVLRPDQCGWLPSPDEFGPLEIEVWNEPDLGTFPTPRLTPEQYAQAVADAVAVCPGGHRLWCGVISNLDLDSLQWLEASIRRWPAHVGVSVHRYPPNGGRPDQPHQGFGSREHEVERLRALTGDRPWMVTECGYHTAEQSTGRWPRKKTWHWTDDEVATFVRWEWDFWARAGAAAAVLYQLNDGTGPGYLDHFGMRRVDGTWKPVADTYLEAA